VNFSFGKGPQAQGEAKSYRWWVAVTERNKNVLAKEYSATDARFTARTGVAVTERLGGIVHPPAPARTVVPAPSSRLLVGFDVTPQMATFNREGKRIRVDARPGAARTQTQTPGMTNHTMSDLRSGAGPKRPRPPSPPKGCPQTSDG
jgi:hypothetical protein